MNDQKTSPADYGFEGYLDWVISSGVGGIAGSIVFGAFIGLFYPDIVSVTIPSLYGLEPMGGFGWGLHLAHGLFLGVIFGFLVTREPALSTLVLEVESGTSYGPSMRLTLAGIVYGLTVWIALPLLALPIWTSITGNVDPDFPAATVESFIGHLLFGATLGFIFSNFIKIPERK